MKRFLLTITDLILSIVMLINVVLLLTNMHTACYYVTMAQCGLIVCAGMIGLVNFVKAGIKKSKENQKELDSLFEEISNEFTVEEIKNIFA